MGSSDGAPSPYNADAGAPTTRKANAKKKSSAPSSSSFRSSREQREQKEKEESGPKASPYDVVVFSPFQDQHQPPLPSHKLNYPNWSMPWTNGWTTVADGTSTKVAEAAAGAGKKGKKANNSSSKAPSSSSVHREDSQRMGCDAMLQLSQMRPDFFRGPGGPDNPYEPWQYDPQPVARAARR